VVKPEKKVNAQEKCEQINDGALGEPSYARGKRFSEHERVARGRAYEQLLNDSEVAFPNDADSIEDRDEEHTLRQDSRRHEGEIVKPAGGNSPETGKYLPKDQEPQCRLYGTRNEFGRIAAQLAQFDIGQGERVGEKIEERKGVSEAV
jgi:hypothetical protein